MKRIIADALKSKGIRQLNGIRPAEKPSPPAKPYRAPRAPKILNDRHAVSILVEIMVSPKPVVLSPELAEELRVRLFGLYLSGKFDGELDGYLRRRPESERAAYEEGIQSQRWMLLFVPSPKKENLKGSRT